MLANKNKYNKTERKKIVKSWKVHETFSCICLTKLYLGEKNERFYQRNEHTAHKWKIKIPRNRFFCKRKHYDLKDWSISSIFILLSYAQQSFHFTANNNLWVIRLARTATLPGRWKNPGKNHVWDQSNRAS